MRKTFSITSTNPLSIHGWVILGLGLSLLTGMLVLQALGCGVLIDTRSPIPSDAFAEVTVTLTGLTFLVLGTIIVRARSENRIGWLCSLTGLSVMVMSFTIEYPGCGFPGGAWVAWIGNAVVLIPLYLMFVLLPLWFPTGQYLSTAWRRLAQVTALVLGSIVLVTAFWPGPLAIIENMGGGIYLNPVNLPFRPSQALDDLIRQAPSLILVAAAIPANASLFARWRLSTGETQQQMKWLAYFMLTAGTFFLLVEGFGGLFFHELFNSWFYLAALTVVWLGYPIIIGIAVLKYRLYDIDLIIRRTLLYSSLTLILAVLYGLTVILLQQVIQALAQGSDPSQIDIVLSTLATAALFNPLRLRLQHLIDRRYYRSRVDKQQILSQVGAALQNEADLDQLRAALLRAVDESMQPEHRSLWVQNRRDS